MKVSSSFVRCGVLCVYLVHVLVRMSWAVALEGDLRGLGVAAVAPVSVPVEAGTRCFGAMVGCVCVCMRGGLYWCGVGELKARCSGTRDVQKWSVVPRRNTPVAIIIPR